MAENVYSLSLQPDSFLYICITNNGSMKQIAKVTVVMKNIVHTSITSQVQLLDVAGSL